MGFGNTLNVTLGLPFIRISVDHGTAYEISGKNKADFSSMEEALKTSVSLL
jgi:4-hydroxythreonine-4-phosphate dehydrogenase